MSDIWRSVLRSGGVASSENLHARRFSAWVEKNIHSVEHGSTGVAQKEQLNLKDVWGRTFRDGTRRPYCDIPAHSWFSSCCTRTTTISIEPQLITKEQNTIEPRYRTSAPLRWSQESKIHVQEQLPVAKPQSLEVQVNDSENQRLATKRDRAQLEDIQVFLQTWEGKLIAAAVNADKESMESQTLFPKYMVGEETHRSLPS